MRDRLKLLWLAETIRLIEKESGRFADQDANRQARAAGSELSDRIMLRAKILSDQNGLFTAQRLLLGAVKLALIILIILSIIAGVTMAMGVLSQDPINLYWALFCLLGLHLVTLVIWLISSFCFSKGSSSLFIYCWLWIVKKLSQKKTIKQLFPAFISLFGHHVRWLIGLIVNLFWTVILSSALVILLTLFSTKHYSFEWKTTLLSPDMVLTITHYLGQLPSLLGFSMPNDTVIKMSEQAIATADVRSAWALWLIGVFIIYGLGIRLCFMIICGTMWLLSCRKIKLNLSHPEYQLLSNDLQSLAVQIIDEDTHHSIIQSYPSSSFTENGNGFFLVAIDIDETWIPPESVNFLGFLNTREQRRHVLDYLQLSPAKKLLVAIDTDRSPDRGILNLINQLMTKAQQNRIWFINHGKQFDNWQVLSLQLASPEWLQGE